jgi:hypothetical protein
MSCLLPYHYRVGSSQLLPALLAVGLLAGGLLAGGDSPWVAVPRVFSMIERPNKKGEVNGPSRGRSIDPKKIFKVKKNLPQVDEIAKMAKWRKW